MKDEDPIALYSYVAAELNKRNIAYLHAMRADFFGVQQGDVLTPIRNNFCGTLIGNMVPFYTCYQSFFS
jgi:N-ethylmaleimide reductase